MASIYVESDIYLSLEWVYTYYVKETIYQHEKIGNTYVYLVMLSTVIAIILWISSDISGKFIIWTHRGIIHKVRFIGCVSFIVLL